MSKKKSTSNIDKNDKNSSKKEEVQTDVESENGTLNTSEVEIEETSIEDLVQNQKKEIHDLKINY